MLHPILNYRHGKDACSIFPLGKSRIGHFNLKVCVCDQEFDESNKSHLLSPLTYRSSDLLCQMEHVPQEHYQDSPDESFGHQRKYEVS